MIKKTFYAVAVLAFTVTLALPDTGMTRVTDHNNNIYNVGNDNPYQGGAVSFDLYWFAAQ